MPVLNLPEYTNFMICMFIVQEVRGMPTIAKKPQARLLPLKPCFPPDLAWSTCFGIAVGIADILHQFL